MRVLIWHVHGSWLTSFVAGPDTYLVPVVPDRGPDGRGLARTWDWPNAREVTPEQLRAAASDGATSDGATPDGAAPDVVVLQRPEEIDLLERWTGLRAGVDVPAVYVEHNTPWGADGARRHPAVERRHPLAERSDIPVVHVTWFNAMAWDCGSAPTTVVEHGVPDPGPLYTGERERIAVVVNEPVRRWRVTGTDVVLDLAGFAPHSTPTRTPTSSQSGANGTDTPGVSVHFAPLCGGGESAGGLPVEVYGMGMAALAELAPDLAPHLHDDVPQAQMHARLAQARAYLHPYRWTSLGLSLLEAMTLGMPVLALATTEAPAAVPPGAGVVSNDPAVLAAAARRWLHDADEAREVGRAARRHALDHYGLDRFVSDWQRVLKEAT